MKIGVRSNNGAEDRLQFAQQIGADGASIWASACPGYTERCYVSVDCLLELRERFDKYELELTGIGLGGDCVKNQLLGLPERDQDIENVCKTIRSIGEAYADGAPSPVVIIDQRTTYWAKRGPWWHPGYERLPLGRGGVRLTTFDADRIQGELDDKPAGEVSREEVWSRIAYFYERIVPVAEEAKVSLEALKRFVELVPSRYNGLLLCLGCMQEAGEYVPEVIRTFGQQKKIFYVHFRNVIGEVPEYMEVFPHEGEGDMVANLQALKEVGYEDYIVPDHHFGFAGDTDWMHCSRAWQVGYLKGLMQALGI